MSKLIKNPLFTFFIAVGVIILLAFIGPEEKSLGSNVRIVYLHGAWVMAAEIAFIAAAFAGLAGLGIRKDVYHKWSAALGRLPEACRYSSTFEGSRNEITRQERSGLPSTHLNAACV